MNRRDTVLALLALGVAPFTSFAQQQGRVWRIGFLGTRRPASLDTDFIGAFPQGLRELGYVEGRNLVIEWRFAEGEVDRLPRLAAELVQVKVDVIVAGALASAIAAQKATTTIPIVVALGNDLVGNGLVKSLARPEGNVTGNSIMSDEIAPKQLEMLLSLVPKAARVAVLLNPANPAHITILGRLQAVPQSSRVKLLPVEARAPHEFEKAFASMTREKADAVIVLADGIFNGAVRQIAELAARNRLPSIYGTRQYVEAGGLMNYGVSFSDSFRRAATYVDKILKGAKPADLPVEQPTKFELVVNMKTAKALGITIPQSVLTRADEVIR